MARMVPLAIGSRISTLSLHFGSRTSSQSFGAASSDTASALKAMTAGVRYTGQ